jgi:beta-glucosidase/6-phospho-beta-glucosidase/beta-galactosidase
VKKWFTVNEPIVFCGKYPLPEGYYTSTTIPKIISNPSFVVKVYSLLILRPTLFGKSMDIKGTVSFKTNGGYKIPLTNSSNDAIAVQRAWDFNESWFAHAVFLGRDFPTYFPEAIRSTPPRF